MSANRRDLARSYPEAVKPEKLAHVVIRTARFAESCAWWAKVLDAKPSYENAQLNFMTYDEEHHRIGIISRPDMAEQDFTKAGVEHIAFTYGELGALLATYQRLKRDEIEPFWCINHGPTISLYYRDPDGTKVELQYDVFPTHEGVQNFFDSGAYEENFMGIIFDPETMIADFEAGTPLEQLVERSPLPAGMSPWEMLRT